MHKVLAIIMALMFIMTSGAAAWSATDNKDRVLAPGDVIEITMVAKDKIVRKIQVPDSRVITFPMIGKMNIKGMTVGQLNQAMTTKLNNNLPEAQVAVVLVKSGGKEEPIGDTAPVRGVAVSDKFILGPGDVLDISVYQDPTLRRQVVVPPDRVISYPLVGDLDVSGMTIPRAQAALAKKMAEYIPDASVSIIITQVGSMTAYVVGKVNKPGQFPITLETSVMQMLSMAGGLGIYADSNSILIVRQQADGPQQFPFNYDAVKRGKNLEQNIILQRGDVIVVP